MKVLFLAGEYPETSNPVSGVFIKEYALLSSRFNEVAVIHGRSTDKGYVGIHCSPPIMEDGILTARFTFGKSLFRQSHFHLYVKGVLEVFSKLCASGFRPDIVHANYYFTGVPAAIIKKRYGIPYVLSEHLSAFPRRRLDRRAVRRARQGMEGASFILPVSKFLEVAIKEYGIKGNFEVVPNAVNPQVFYPSQRVMPEERRERKILTVAGLNPCKNYPFLFSALKILKENQRNGFQLRIVGEGQYRHEYESLVHNLGLKNEVLFLGRKTKPEIADLMRESDFFVLPSLCETFGCVLIEALACGLPVIASRVGPIPELIKPEHGILIDPTNLEELVTALKFMLENHHKYDPMKISGYAWKNFSHSAIGKRLEEVYRKTIYLAGNGL